MEETRSQTFNTLLYIPLISLREARNCASAKHLTDAALNILSHSFSEFHPDDEQSNDRCYRLFAVYISTYILPNKETNECKLSVGQPSSQ